jgi:hypothetical protein
MVNIQVQRTGQWPSGNARMGAGSRRGFDPVPHATSVKDFQQKSGAGRPTPKKTYKCILVTPSQFAIGFLFVLKEL